MSSCDPNTSTDPSGGQDAEDFILEECSNEEDDQNTVPYVGMRFPTYKEAYTFYNTYAGRVGFSVRKATQTKLKQGMVSSMRWVCWKQGFGKRQKELEMSVGGSNRPNTPEKEKGMTRVGCMASFRIKLVEGAMWEVSVFEEKHNHPLVASPSKKRNLRSQKRMSKEEKEIILNLSAQNVGTSQILEYISSHCGGKGNIRFKKQDVSNLIAAIKRKLIGIDVSTTVIYFKKKQEKDPEFFYAIEPDDNGTVKNIFWVDGRARRAYQEFGDVVTFDTTYQTNKYNMPLAPILGANHHRHSILFGMSLLRDESADNFCWLFKTWLVAMYDKHPKAIITDQDPAMRKAIKIVFPNTVHRCCQWHVMTKARDHFGALYNQLEGFGERLGMVINRSLTIPEFEKNWTAMLDEFSLHGNKHLQVMHASQSEWVPAYFRDTFFANMSTTQRSESINAVFKLWVNNHTSIYQFVLQTEKMIESIWHRESDEDLKSMNEKLSPFSPWLIESEAFKIYTKNVYLIFKEKLRDSLLGVVTEIDRDTLYKVSIGFHPNYRTWIPESFMVEVDKENRLFQCNCKGFSFEGLLCSHAIKVMNHIGMTNIPLHPRYILKRWTRDANVSVKIPINVRSMEHGETLELKTLRFASIKSDLMRFGEMGCETQSAFKLLKSILSDGLEKLENLVPKNVTEEGMTIEDEVATAEGEKTPMEPFFSDPPQSQCKGRKKKPTRFKRGAEIKGKGKKMRTCSVCGEKEGHNARTCPQKAQGKGKKRANEDVFSEEDSTDYESG